MTAQELSTEIGEKESTMRKRWTSVYGRGVPLSFSVELTEYQVRVLSGKKGRAELAARKVSGDSIPEKKSLSGDLKPAGPKGVPPAIKNREPYFMLIAPLAITALSICLTIVGLYVFSSWAGAMIGGMFSLFLLTSVLIARDRMKGATSEQALKTVLHLECGAAVLHCFTFWRLLPEFPEQFQPARVMICAALAGFAAYLSYSAVLTVRNYNAEV